MTVLYSIIKERTTSPLLTVGEYMQQDYKSSQRLEFYDGVLRAMSGGTSAHNTIALNMASYLRLHAIAQNCKVYMENMRFQVSEKYFFYPDVMVTCEQVEDSQRTALKACFVAEILSESTFANDFARKLPTYMNNPHIQTIVYVLQTERRVFVYQKMAEAWELNELTTGEIVVPCIGATLTVEQIYEQITFPETAS